MSGVQLMLFANDITLYFRARYKKSTLFHLQRAIDELYRWFRNWRIEVNPDKSAAIRFKYSKRSSRQIIGLDTLHLRMLNTNIPWQFNYKYLGITLDRNLHFEDYIEYVRKTTLSYRGHLDAMLGRKRKLSLRNKFTMYQVCIRSTMIYPSHIFAHDATKALDRLQVLQNKFLRDATDAHWYVRNLILHRDLKLLIRTKFIKEASKQFFDIAESNPNAPCYSPVP
ncbi:RNA-directed DNA polymerase from mobile element jockey [Eumeta japonica]|uniref:RNA-directed DNA polymerase from mobile element jockey n=1 Tax=Eumeta variegata TaxID=151549 RepID=A0A4C1SVD6_EUMVA|nr:RNA-directed DNA polymerase from mobile element jockey [Eumeta japonica]